MKDVRLVPYIKKLEHSYSFGVFPTIELLENKPGIVVKVLIHSRGKQNSGVQKILSLCQKKGIRTESNDGLIQKIGGNENSYAVGVFMKYKEEIEPGKNHLVLVSPEDTGNLGTMVRTALGFGIKNIAIIRPAVDCFDPKSVRASMGSIFGVKIEYFEDFGEYQKRHDNKCFVFMTDAKKELSEVKFTSPFSLVFGSESAGLDGSYESVGESVFIRQTKDIDSLNLSIAAGIAMYQSFVK